MMNTDTAASDQTQDKSLIFAPRDVVAQYRADGSVLLRSPFPLQGEVTNIVDYLEQWATETPNGIFLGQRNADGGWDELSYGLAWQRVQAVAQALLDLGLTAETPVAILSGASLEHAILSYAAMLVGIPVAPVSPAYSLLPGALPRLAGVAEILRPGLVFVQCTEQYQNARTIPELSTAIWVTGTPGQQDATDIADLYQTLPGPRMAEARQQVTHDTVGKILFTSGSTGAPKGVINTQRMLCSDVTATAQVVAYTNRPILLDWLPWHHTMGGNSSMNGSLRVGGALYIDEGRPTTEAAFQATLDNIRSVKPTSLLSVPAALQMLVDALEKDDSLRRAFFSRMQRLIYAGAALDQNIYDRMQAMAMKTAGHEIYFGSGYGTTETSPTISIKHWISQNCSEIGLPVPGLTLKLVPVEDRYEVRVKGASVTPGYYRAPDLTAAAFDGEGYYCVGDLVQFIDPENPSLGLRFAGRLSENFKLTNGSWVATSELRLAVLDACRPLITDLVIAGQDRDDIRLLVWASPQAREQIGAPAEGALAPEHYQALATAIAGRLTVFNESRSGKTHRVAAFRILHEAPSLGDGETTDKGYVNQRGVLHKRAALVDDLYAKDSTPEVVHL